ncbi:MAG: PilZ domain-containing protein [candidate division Zixibacteria bacterium]|nr:PilZ domain-containing protein [candidate division Zixibacteria bacterium]
MSVNQEKDRVTVQALLEVFERKTSDSLGYLANYSPGGLMIIGKKQISPGTEFECKMSVPDNILSNREMFFSLKTVWCEEDIVPGDYTIGFQFEHIDKEDFRLLVSISENLLTQSS